MVVVGFRDLTMSADFEDGYRTFKGMGTTAMVQGIPLIPGLCLFAFGLVTGFIGCIAFGLMGLIGPALSILALVALKFICETDNKALEAAKWKAKAWILRLKKVSTVLTVSASAMGSRYAHLLRHLKQIHRSR